jgi:hypothetical protein
MVRFEKEFDEQTAQIIRETAEPPVAMPAAPQAKASSQNEQVIHQASVNMLKAAQIFSEAAKENKAAKRKKNDPAISHEDYED